MRQHSLEIHHIATLIDSGEHSLVSSGFRALVNTEALSIVDERLLRTAVDQAIEQTRDHPELGPLGRAAAEYMALQHERIVQEQVLVDDSEYTPGHEPTEAELAAAWGPEEDGLSLAVFPWERDSATFEIGDHIEADLIVRNVSDVPQKFCVHCTHSVVALVTDEQTRNSARLVVRQAADWLYVSFSTYGPLFRKRHLLAP